VAGAASGVAGVIVAAVRTALTVIRVAVGMFAVTKKFAEHAVVMAR
jgi:hypothetical protein